MTFRSDPGPMEAAVSLRGSWSGPLGLRAILGRTCSSRRGIATTVALVGGLAVAGIGAGSAGAAAWGFEQVTPVNKGAGAVHAVDTFRASPDGNALLHSATSSYDAVPSESIPQYVRYIATRDETGWSNRGMDPAFDTGSAMGALLIMAVLGSSVDLKYVVVASSLALTPGATAGGSNLYMRDTSDGSLQLIVTTSDKALLQSVTTSLGAGNIRYVDPSGRAALFSSIVPLVPGAAPSALYSWTAEGGIRAESVLPAAQGAGIVNAQGVQESGARRGGPVRDGMRRVPFGQASGGVYIREGGVTKALSVSRRAGGSTTPVNATLQASSDGGRFVLFTADGAPLTDEAPSTLGIHHYLYDADDDSLRWVGTAGSNGERVSQLSSDGTVIFQSRVALAAGAVSGATIPHLYVWRDGDTRLIYRPDSGSSGASASFVRIMSENGRFFTFNDTSTSLASRFGFDNRSLACSTTTTPAPCDMAYRYDIEQDELSCVSCRTDGNSAAGPVLAPGPNARMDLHVPQTVANDGTVFFTTADGLLAGDSNGESDVYASSLAGGLRLVSRAAPGARSRFLDANPDGSSVFFASTDPIAVSDDDRSMDIYMTRIGIGSDEAVETPVPCSGHECRKAGGLAQLALVAPATGTIGGVLRSSPAAPRPTVRVTAVRTRSGSLRVRVRASTEGRLRISGSRLRTRALNVERGTRELTVRLSSRGRALLRQKRRVAVRLRVSLGPPFGRSAVTTSRRVVKR